MFAPEIDVFTASVTTEGELAAALAKAETCDKPAFIELHLDPFDAPAPMKPFGRKAADFDYGPRGPQEKD